MEARRLSLDSARRVWDHSPVRKEKTGSASSGGGKLKHKKSNPTSPDVCFCSLSAVFFFFQSYIHTWGWKGRKWRGKEVTFFCLVERKYNTTEKIFVHVNEYFKLKIFHGLSQLFIDCSKFLV